MQRFIFFQIQLDESSCNVRRTLDRSNDSDRGADECYARERPSRRKEVQEVLVDNIGKSENTRIKLM